MTNQTYELGRLWLAGCGSQDFNPQTWKSKRGYLIQFSLLCALTLSWGLVQRSQAMLHFGRELREEGSTHREGRKKEKDRASRHPHTQKEKKKKTTSTTQYRDLFQEEELNKSKRNRWKSRMCKKRGTCMYVYVPLAMSVEG
jgi:hypothetical protein